MSRQITTPRRTQTSGPAARRLTKLGIPVPSAPRINWRWISVLLTIALLGLGTFIFASPLFYVTRAEIGGHRYIPPEEFYTESGAAGYHILWVDPVVISERLEKIPGVAAVDVFVQWPARLIIVVREREPALVWEQEGVRYWVDVNGILMVQRTDLPALPRIVNEGQGIPFHCPGPTCTQPDIVSSIEPAVVQGALQIKTLHPELGVLYYDTVRGLSFDDGRGWRGYFGIGVDMHRKFTVYEALIGQLYGRGIQPSSIDVSNPEAPVYRVAR